MAKQNPKTKPPSKPPVNTGTKKPVKGIFKITGRTAYVLIFVFSCLLYSNTVKNKYAVDDPNVLTENRFTKKGFGGIKDLLSHDMFEGALGEQGANVVSGGRYRPLSMVSFAMEYELMRKLRHDSRAEITDKNVIIGEYDPYLSPTLSHLINILLLAITGMVLYYLLKMLFPQKDGGAFYLSLPFIITMLYVAHPIHTEAVANIKGRDELFSMLFSISALILFLKYLASQKPFALISAMFIYFLALLSKENAITFLAIVPLTFYFFTNAKGKDYGIALGALAIPVVLSLFLRSHFTHASITQDSSDILNNPFLLADAAQRLPTAVATILSYFKLLLIPHPLTSDYYYNQIPYSGYGSMAFILSLLVTLGFLAYAFLGLRKKTIPSFAILFFFITFSVATNILFTIGVLMNERFVFMSSLGFCILLAYLLINYIKKPVILSVVFLSILLLYSIKTFSRNYDWKNDITLLGHDVHTSPNSTRIHTMLGNLLTLEADKHTDAAEKQVLLDSALTQLDEGIKIYPNNAFAWLLKGNANYKRNNNPAEAIPVYQKAVELYKGSSFDASFDLGLMYNENKQVLEAKKSFLQAVAANPGRGTECGLPLAQVFAKLNLPDSVSYWLKQAETNQAISAADYYHVGIAFARDAGNYETAIFYVKKAIESDPTKEIYYENLGTIYGLSGNYSEAINTTEKLVKLNPNYASAYKNLAVLYTNVGKKDLAAINQQKYLQLTQGTGK